MKKCRHVFMSGFGATYDAFICVKCGYSKYPEVLSWWTRFTCKVIPNNRDCMSFNEYPFIRKCPKVVSWTTDPDEYIGYYNRDGVFTCGKYDADNGLRQVVENLLEVLDCIPSDSCDCGDLIYALSICNKVARSKICHLEGLTPPPKPRGPENEKQKL